MRQHVPPQQLWNEFHGDLEFEYDHDTYWPALLQLCEERQAEQRERWIRAGKNLGESELYIKGGDTPSISSTVPSNDSEDIFPPKIQEASTSEPSTYEAVKVYPQKHVQQPASTSPVYQDEKAAPVGATADSTEVGPAV